MVGYFKFVVAICNKKSILENQYVFFRFPSLVKMVDSQSS